jgi:hypothetical protein
MNSALADRLSGRWCSAIRGRWQWTTNGFGWFWLLAYSPQLALFRLDWHVMRVAGGANTGANGANVRWRGGGYERDIVRE